MSSARENDKAEKGYKKCQGKRFQYCDQEHLKRQLRLENIRELAIKILKEEHPGLREKQLQRHKVSPVYSKN